MEDNTEVKIDDSKIIEEILSDKMLDIVIELLDKELMEEELLNKLEMAPLRLKVYLKKLLGFGIVECVKEDIRKQKSSMVYKLKQDNIELLMNNINNENKIPYSIIKNIPRYQEFISVIFKNMSKHPQICNKFGFTIIRCNDEKIKEFKIKLNCLIDEFINIEDKQKEDMYILVNLLAPYKLE